MLSFSLRGMDPFLKENHQPNKSIKTVSFFHCSQNGTFQLKKKSYDIFLSFAPDIGCGYSLGGSNEFPQY